MKKIALTVCCVLATAGGVAHADLLAYESFSYGSATESGNINGYQDTFPGYSTGLSGAWSRTYDNSATLKSRSSSTGWTGAQANLTTQGINFSLLNYGGYFSWLECNDWGLEQAQVSLATPIDMNQNGTWYMSFVSSAGAFNYAALMGLNDGNNELMWGNGYTGSGQGVTAHFGAMSSYNTGGSIAGTSAISPTMANGWDVMLYVAQLQQDTVNGLTVNMYAYDLNTITSLPSDIGAAGTALWSTTLTGVSGTFNNLELDLSGASNLYPSIGELRIGTTWADVTTVVPEPPSMAMLGFGFLAFGAFVRNRKR